MGSSKAKREIIRWRVMSDNIKFWIIAGLLSSIFGVQVLFILGF